MFDIVSSIHLAIPAHLKTTEENADPVTSVTTMEVSSSDRRHFRPGLAAMALLYSATVFYQPAM